jgi:hypothetical protein
MDLSTLDTKDTANEGAAMELRGPNGAPLFKADGTPITITLLGKDSDTYVADVNANANRFLKQRGNAVITAEGSKADAIKLLSKCTVGWDGITVDGAELPWSRENAVKLYNRFAWIKEQVDEFIADRANFTKASPTG